MRSISRVTKCSINTVVKLLIDAGNACIDFHDKNVHGLSCRRIQCDEIWSFTYAKQKNVGRAKDAPTFAGDVWTWTSLCADCKLICNWMVGGRDAEYAEHFMRDLAARLDHRVQLSTDGHKAYLDAVQGVFGFEVDFATLVKMYGHTTKRKGGKQTPVQCIGVQKVARIGAPSKEHVSTSYVERQNLSMRSHMRRYTRQTIAFSKKFENHCHALSLYFVFYNFIRIHMTLKTTPAVRAGLAEKPYDMEWIISLIDARAPKKGRPKKVLTPVS